MVSLFFKIFFLILFIYLRERERMRMSKGGRAEGKGEADSTLIRETHMRLNLRTLGS